MAEPFAKATNLAEFTAWLKSLDAAARGKNLEDAAMAGGMVGEGYAKINAQQTFSGTATGGAGLAGSITTDVVEKTDTMVRVGVGPTVVYGRIHELGGLIKPVHAKALRFVINGEVIYTQLVHMPARPYLRPAIEQHWSEIQAAMAAVLRKRMEATQR